MFFERYFGFRAFIDAAKMIGVSFFGATIFLVSSVFESSATAQTSTNFGAGATRSANVVATGIPARVEPSAAPSGTGTVRVRTENTGAATAPPTNVARRVAARPRNAETIRGASRTAGSNAVANRNNAAGTRSNAVSERLGAEPVNNNGANNANRNVFENASAPVETASENGGDETSTYLQTFDAPTSLPTVGFQLQIKRYATREEAERETAPSGGYWAILPRENFLKENPEDPQNLSNAARAGIDARVRPDGTAAVEPNFAIGTATATESSSGKGDVVAFALNGLQPDEARLLRDSEDGRWDETDLFDAALIAEGLTTAQRRAPYRAKFERLVGELNAATAFDGDQLSKTETIYTFLHKKVLTSQYNLNCSSLVASLDSGVFNCVSATTLFNCFAERSGLRVAALETTGHAKSRVKFADSFLDLETTCSSWERLPDKLRPYSRSVAVARPVQPSAGIDATVVSAPNGRARISNETAFANDSRAIVRGADGGERSGSNSAADEKNVENAANSASINRSVASNSGSLPNAGGNSNVSVNAVAELGSTTFDPRTFEAEGAAPIGYSHTRNRRPMREIGEVELVATIYYNVGVDFYQNERYEEAVAAYIKAARLAPNNLTILGNLKATLNNWAIQIAMKEKDFERAIQITEQGMILDPNFEEYRMNLPIFFQHWTTYLAKDNRWDEVARVEQEYRKRFPKPTLR